MHERITVPARDPWCPPLLRWVPGCGAARSPINITNNIYVLPTHPHAHPHTHTHPHTCTHTPPPPSQLLLPGPSSCTKRWATAWATASGWDSMSAMFGALTIRAGGKGRGRLRALCEDPLHRVQVCDDLQLISNGNEGDDASPHDAQGRKTLTVVRGFLASHRRMIPLHAGSPSSSCYTFSSMGRFIAVSLTYLAGLFPR